MRSLIIVIFTIFAAACGKKEDACLNPPPAPDGRPAILVIGDSISYGWTPFVQAALPNYQVIHNPCNAADSINGAQHIEEWLHIRPHWTAVIWNHGAWDVSYGRGITGPDYQYAINVEAYHIEHYHTDHALFVLTTSVPIHDSTRSVGSEIAYNREAVNIMNKWHIPYVDNYTLSLTIQNLRQDAARQNNVHWTDAGSEDFANNILDSLNTLYGIN